MPLITRDKPEPDPVLERMVPIREIPTAQLTIEEQRALSAIIDHHRPVCTTCKIPLTQYVPIRFELVSAKVPQSAIKLNVDNDERVGFYLVMLLCRECLTVAFMATPVDGVLPDAVKKLMEDKKEEIPNDTDNPTL